MKKNPNRSKKHHYLPRYYLKGFTDSDGDFFVYDKINDNLFKSSPDNSFFQNNMNTIKLPNGELSDFVEKYYSLIEGKSWKSFDIVRDSSYKEPVSNFEKMNLFLFFLFLYWRLPINKEIDDDLYDSLFHSEGKHNYFKIANSNGLPVGEDVLSRIKESSSFRDAINVTLAFAPFLKDSKWYEQLMDWQFLYTGDGSNWHFISDNPFISKSKNKSPFECLKNVVVPISGRVLLMTGCSKSIKHLDSEFLVQYCAAMIDNANRFVSSSNEKFLKTMIGYYKQNMNEDHVELMYRYLE